MLEEHEWQLLVPHLQDAIEQIKRQRIANGSSIAQASAAGFGQEALRVYFELTGFRETNVNALWHHRLSHLGPLCTVCAKPLRTPQAKHCAECGAMRPNLSLNPDASPAALTRRPLGAG